MDRTDIKATDHKLIRKKPPKKMIAFLNIKKTTLILLAAVFLISLGIRLYLLDQRWINPDEGAHLMDGVLLLDGKIPLVDFNSRQPFYVYMIALFLKIFGANYVSGRLLPITCSMLTGIVVFIIAKLLFNENVAVLSSAIYWMLPLELMNSVLVKTEPLVVLLTSLSFYGLIRFWKSDRAVWLIGAGGSGALAYYVRQSSLIIPLTSFAFILILHRGQVRAIAKSFGNFMIGYAAVLFAVMTYYSRYMSFERLITDYDVSPFGTVSGLVRSIVYRIQSGSSSGSVISQTASMHGHSFDDLRDAIDLHSVTSDGVSPLARSIDYHNGAVSISGSVNSQTALVHAHSFDYLRDAIDLHSFLIIGLIFSIMTLGGLWLASKKREVFIQEGLSRLLPYLWILSLFSAYAAYYVSKGFLIDYFREFLPPLVMIFSAWVNESLPGVVADKEKITQRLILGGLPLLGIFFFFQATHRDFSGMGIYGSIAIAVVALLSFIGTFESSTRRFFFALSLLAIIAFIVVPRQTLLKAYLSGPLPSLGMIGVIYGVTWLYLNGKGRPVLGAYRRFVALSIATAALVLSVSYSALLLNVAYDTPWSPESVKNVAAYLLAHTGPDDEVMSGAVIWELQAARRPFHMVSHPLHFMFDIPEEQRQALILALSTHPPKVIILDGYTEKTYIRQIPSILELLRDKYELAATGEPAKFPVRVYQLREDPAVRKPVG